MEQCQYCEDIIVMHKVTRAWEAETFLDYCPASQRMHSPVWRPVKPGEVRPVAPPRMPGPSHWGGCSRARS